MFVIVNEGEVKRAGARKPGGGDGFGVRKDELNEFQRKILKTFPLDGRITNTRSR